MSEPTNKTEGKQSMTKYYHINKDKQLQIYIKECVIQN